MIKVGALYDWNRQVTSPECGRSVKAAPAVALMAHFSLGDASKDFFD
jgi:hypothetical protein